MTHTLEDEIIRTLVLWGSSAAWAAFVTDYRFGHVEIISTGGHMGLVTSASDNERLALYRWCMGHGSDRPS